MMSARSIPLTLVLACVVLASHGAYAQEENASTDRLEEEIEGGTSPAPAPASGREADPSQESTTAPPSNEPLPTPTPSPPKANESAASTSQPAAKDNASGGQEPQAALDIPQAASTGSEAPPANDDENPAATGDFNTDAAARYVLSYSLDWTYVMASIGLRAAGVWDRIRPPNTWIGPNFQEDENSLTMLQEPRLFGAYNQPMLQEKVSVTSLFAAGAIGVAVATSVDGALNQDAHRAHVLGLGALVSTVFTADVTEALKLGVGRLRPDFAERYQRAACQGLVDAPLGLDCTPFNDGFVLDEKDYVDGFKSFPSGHASTSFALATYLSLWLNRTWVFGKRATAISQPLAVLASGLLYSGAFFTAASRVSDHRHHLEDVAVGAALGTGIGAATWLLYFDADGEARTRSWAILPQSYRDGGGVSLSGSF